MNIEYALAEVLGNGDQLEEAGHHDEVDSRLAAGGEDRLAVALGRLEIGSSDRPCGNPSIAGMRQSAGVRRAGDDESNLDR